MVALLCPRIDEANIFYDQKQAQGIKEYDGEKKNTATKHKTSEQALVVCLQIHYDFFHYKSQFAPENRMSEKKHSFVCSSKLFAFTAEA